MSVDQNKETVVQFFKSFDNRQIEQAFQLMAPNFVAHMMGMPAPLDASEFKEFGKSFYLAFDQGKHVFDEIVAENDRVVTAGTFTAIHQGEFQGLPPTGKPITIEVAHVDVVQDGLIVKHWGMGNAFGLMQQLGIVSIPGPKLVPHILKGIASKVFKNYPLSLIV